MESLQTLETAAGRLTLRSLELSLTYDGLIVGAPNRELNDEHLHRRVKDTRHRWHYPVHLVEPPRTVRTDRAPHPRGGPYELLPPVECLGLFHGRATPRAEGDWWFTALIVLWYQDHGDALIHPRAAERLHDIPWDHLAKDFSFDDM